MLKFFRRIRQSLLSENKFPKFLLCDTYKILLIIIFTSFLSGCDTKSNKDKSELNTSYLDVITKDSISINELWMQAINNKDIQTLEKLYTKDVYGISSIGIDFSSRDTLISIVKNNDFVVKEVQTIKRIEASKNYDYEIGSFKNKSDGLMKYVIIWDTSDEVDKRALEFLAITDSTHVDLKEIDTKRVDWIERCNAHNAVDLINKVYTKNTMYYNHRPMVVGREQLVPVYSYMNNPDYTLTLNPIIVEPVSESIVYEIGQCSGSYNGKYILIWQKTSEGWQVLFDANI